MVMEVAAFRAGVFVLFVFIPQINLGVDKQLHQIAVELPFFLCRFPRRCYLRGRRKGKLAEWVVTNDKVVSHVACFYRAS